MFSELVFKLEESIKMLVTDYSGIAQLWFLDNFSATVEDNFGM